MRERDRVAEQIKTGRRNGRLKERQNEKVKSDGKAFSVHSG